MAERIDRDELRALIREALKEALGAAPVPPPSLATGEGDHAKHGGGGDAGAASGIRPLHRLRRSPSPAPRVRNERRGAATTVSRPACSPKSKVAEIGRTHSKIIIGTDVAVTPLARDRAREIRIEIVRQKP